MSERDDTLDWVRDCPSDAVALIGRLEQENAALKAKFAELEKQEPVGSYWGMEKEYGYNLIDLYDDLNEGAKLYSVPVIPDLERKLLEARIEMYDSLATDINLNLGGKFYYLAEVVQHCNLQSLELRALLAALNKGE